MSQFRIVHDGECHSLRGWSEMWSDESACIAWLKESISGERK